MLGKLIPVLFLLLGSGAGVGAALLMSGMAPADPPGGAATAHASGHGSSSPDSPSDPGHAGGGAPTSGDVGDGHGDGAGLAGVEYVRLNNQFVVPVVDRQRVAALVVLSLSLETDAGTGEAVYAREPKLRDGFLRVLFDHANMGGFDGAFTRAENLETLREALREVARAELGPAVRDVLILDIARQDV